MILTGHGESEKGERVIGTNLTRLTKWIAEH